LGKSVSTKPEVAYEVHVVKRVLPISIRSGISSSKPIEQVLRSTGKPFRSFRYCPIGSKSGVDVEFLLIEKSGLRRMWK